jgi:hypothetical protein
VHTFFCNSGEKREERGRWLCGWGRRRKPWAAAVAATGEHADPPPLVRRQRVVWGVNGNRETGFSGKRSVLRQ